MKKRTYSVFVDEGKDGKHSYTRISALALVLKDARRIFQGALLGGSMIGLRMELRPAEEDFANDEVYKANRDRLFPTQ